MCTGSISISPNLCSGLKIWWSLIRRVLTSAVTSRLLGPKKYMCVSDFMGLQNRVGSSGIIFFAIFFYCEILDKFWLITLRTYLKVVRFTSFFYIWSSIKKIESHNKKTSVGKRQMGEIFLYCTRVRFLFKYLRQVSIFALILEKNSWKPHKFSQNGPIYLHFCSIWSPIKKTLHRTMKKSVGEKMVCRSGNRKTHIFFPLNRLELQPGNYSVLISSDE